MPKRLVDGEGVWRSRKLRQVELKYRGEYANLLPLANDKGAFECDPDVIWADVYSFNRPDITPEDVRKILDEFERVKLLYRWQVNNKTWGYWVGIERSGLLPKPSERYSKDPEPDPGALARFTGGLPAGEPREGAGTPLQGLGLGCGSGFGLGSGSASAEAATAAAQRSSAEEEEKKTPQVKIVSIEEVA